MEASIYNNQNFKKDLKNWLTYFKASAGSLHAERFKDFNANVDVKNCLKDGSISRDFLLPKPLRDRFSWERLLVQPLKSAPKT